MPEKDPYPLTRENKLGLSMVKYNIFTPLVRCHYRLHVASYNKEQLAIEYEKYKFYSLAKNSY